MKTLPVARIRSLFDCDPVAGKLVWRFRDESDFADARGLAFFTNHYAGEEAGFVDARGYRIIVIDTVNYLAHRLMWAHVYGEWPPQFIDHVNGDRADNRIDNLRLADYETNGKNRSRARNNTSGITGVSWEPRRGAWVAYIRSGGRKVHLGYFLTKAEAAAARQRANHAFGYHPNHGQREATYAR